MKTIKAPDPRLDPALMVNKIEESRRIRDNNNSNNNNNNNNNYYYLPVHSDGLVSQLHSA